ncbi:toxin-antitoxin system YwqK family antitoxin [Flavobacterium sp. 14A]|uniref:toxin-antitoxin system YwqK family antitoxin n=1 Tax=Flavobacterium sp. 14A TaxID=2735896 RepID=UPI00156F8543|nr:hypothetical protein [Flavobacterium sp. 14A]NRT12470.1 antitoxin component YwqK of YwqJK toxin-antitoxin module [Flavobacterium sp. 14A]
MKKSFTLIVLTLFISTALSAQKLSLNDLSNLCSKKTWQDVNQYMLVKGWTYYDSTKGDTDNYSTITWSYNKESYSNKAQAWFYIYTFDDYPNKISYNVFNKASYLLIQNSLVTNGFKIVDSEIQDEMVITTYANASYRLIITNSKTTEDKWSTSSVTSYNITLIKKLGIYDNANGKKVDYYDDGTVKSEYSLVNGKLDGPYTFYDESGNIKKTGGFKNGQIIGKVIEYNKDGTKDSDYYFVNDKMNGLSTSYYYDSVTKLLTAKEVGYYVEDEKEGIWDINIIDEKIEKRLFYTTYHKGIKEGEFQEVQGDTLIKGSYKNDLLNGAYKVYIDPIKSLLEKIINTKIDDLRLAEEGQYYNGKKTAYWKTYDISASLISEGNYLDGDKTGEWKFYNPNYVKENGTPEPFAKKLLLQSNYVNGKLNGRSERFYMAKTSNYPCRDIDNNHDKIDSCFTTTVSKIHEVMFYKNDLLHGNYELRDSINQIKLKGQFVNDLREGKWTSYLDKNIVDEEIEYKAGLNDGKYIVYDVNYRPSIIKEFQNGLFTQSKFYLGEDKKIVLQLNVIDRYSNHVKIKQIDYQKDGVLSKVYWMKNLGDDEVSLDSNFLKGRDDIKNSDTIFADGDYLLTTLDNRPLLSGVLYKNKKFDTWTSYYYDQKVKIEEKYINNAVVTEIYFNIDGTLFSGEFEFFDGNLNVKEVRKIKDGLRNGKTSYIDSTTNKTIRKENYKEGKLKS